MLTRIINKFEYDYLTLYNYAIINNSSCNIILLAVILIYMFIIVESILESIITLNKNYKDRRLNGKYRYCCSGTTLNNKRCKNRVIKSDMCYNHN